MKKRFDNPNEIFTTIISDQLNNFRDKTFIILGTPGPTGKSTLCKRLIDRGYNAIDISEGVCGRVSYTDEDNYMLYDRNHKQVFIFLNKLLKEKKPKVKVVIEETISQEFEVEVSSLENAPEEIEKMYRKDKLELNNAALLGAKMGIVDNNGKIKEDAWIDIF